MSKLDEFFYMYFKEKDATGTFDSMDLKKAYTAGFNLAYDLMAEYSEALDKKRPFNPKNVRYNKEDEK